MICLFVVEVNNFQFLVFVDDGNVFVVEVYDFVCVFDDRAGIATEEKLAVADSYDKRATLSSCYDLIGIVSVEYGDGVCAYNGSQRHSNCGEKVKLLFCLHVVNQLHKHFCVCVADKLDSFFLQSLFQYCIVFNDAIVDYC